MTTESAIVEATATPIDISRGAIVTMTPEQRKDYKATGNLPTPKTEEAAASSVQGESETPKQQVVPKGKPPLTAEERISQLEAQNAKNAKIIEDIRKNKGIEKPSKPAEATAAKPEVIASAVRPKPTPDDTNKDGTPKYATHEDYILDLSDWRGEVKDAEKAEQARKQAEESALNDKVEKARSRYENLDEVVNPAIDTIVADKGISPVIKQMLYDSDITPDLVYTIASNEKEFQDFLKMARETPGKAIRYVALTESLIAQGFAEEAKPAVEEAPAKPTTKAPKPPAEAGGRAAAPPDSLQAAVEASKGSLSRDLKAEFLRRDLAKLKG